MARGMRGWILGAALVALVAGGAGVLGAVGQPETATLNFAISANPDTLDPQRTAGTLTFQTVRSFYDTLVEPDPNGRIIPALAERWESSPDGLVWTFKLRQGVKFHNGDVFAARDVKATLERIMAEATGSPKRSEVTAISSIATPDDNTVVITLSKYTPLLATLASGWGAILPSRLIASSHDFARQPVGTGPFRFVEWVRDSRLVLDRNADYWMKGYPKLSRVNMNIVPERVVQVQGLLTGALDVAVELTDADARQLEAGRDTTVQRGLSSMVFVLAMNCSRPGLSDVRLRQAVSQAVDKQRVLDTAYGGGKVVGTFMDYSSVYYKELSNLLPFDPEKAKRLVAEVGAPAQRELELALPQNYEQHVKAGEIYQDMLTRIGLKVKIRLMDWSTWLSDVYRGGNYDLTVIAHTGKLDPDGRLAGYGTDKTYVKWVNAGVASLIDKARTTLAFDARKQLYDQVLEAMAREVPQVYVGTAYRYIGLRKNVSGFIMDPTVDTFDFRMTEKK